MLVKPVKQPFDWFPFPAALLAARAVAVVPVQTTLWKATWERFVFHAGQASARVCLFVSPPSRSKIQPSSGQIFVNVSLGN